MEELILKEDIENYKIIPAPADHSKDFIEKLDRATRLGNEFKAKTNLVFQTAEGAKRVEATVWCHDEDYLQLKSGIILPLKSLIDVDY